MDGLFERLRRDGIGVAVAMVVGAVIWTRGWRVPAGVAGGVVLAAVSVFSIGSSITELSSRAGRALLKMVFRYALLAFLAYVMIARLRLPPVALIAGVSCGPIAVAIEAARLLARRR
jgi:uncharacterized membrane protein